MKKSFYLLLPLLLCKSALFAQCGSGACPAGSINTLPAGGTIAAGTTYCIAGPITNTTDYTINGTLIIQSGSVTVRNLTVGKTGSIIVTAGSKLMANSYTGDATAPASVISNVTVCSNGYLYLSGAINPGETNFTIHDYGVFTIYGSWSTIISDTYFKIGMGALVEMCSSFTFKSGTGFFTETSNSPSYVVTRSAMANGAGAGDLSTLGAASQIKWAIPGGPIAWVTHPAANTCNGAACGVTLPPGAVDNGLCGSVSTSYLNILLPLRSHRTAQPVSTEQARVFPNPATNFIHISAIADQHFTLATVINSLGQELLHVPLSTRTPFVRCELPASLPAGFYCIRLTGQHSNPLMVRVLKTP